MKRKKSLSILAQLIIIVSGITLIPLTLLSIYFHKTFRTFSVDQLIERQLKSLNQLEQNLVRVRNELDAMIFSFDNSLEIEEKLSRTYKSQNEKIGAISELELRLIDKVKDYSWVDCNLVLIGKNHTIFSSCIHTPDLSTDVIYNSYWYKKNENDIENVNYKILNRSYFDPFDSSNNIVAIKNLVNKATKKVYGIAILEIKESYFYDIYKDMLEDGELLYLQTSERKVLSTSDRNVSLTLDPKDILLPPGKSDIDYSYHFMNKEYIYIFKKAQTGIWDIVNLIPLEILNAQFVKYNNLVFWIEFFSFSIALIGIIFISNRIYVPVHTLLAKLRKPLKLENSRDFIRSSGIVPFYKLHKNDGIPKEKKGISFFVWKPKKTPFMEYEELMEEVNQTVERLMLQEDARKKAELMALAMQIRPHFLYNTLNSIKCLVWTKEYDKIEPTITSLVKLLRNALSQGGKLISIEMEKENIKLFVDILNLRMDNKIVFKYDLDEKLKDLKVPSFLLQPLVENSIFHGLNEKKNSLTVILSVYEEEDSVVLEVMDTGIGVEPEKLMEINRIFSGEKDKIEEKEFHIGLSNIYNRLKWNYGEEASIRINSQENQGTVVRIRMNKKRIGDISDENNDSR